MRVEAVDPEGLTERRNYSAVAVVAAGPKYYGNATDPFQTQMISCNRHQHAEDTAMHTAVGVAAAVVAVVEGAAAVNVEAAVAVNVEAAAAAVAVAAVFDAAGDLAALSTDALPLDTLTPGMTLDNTRMTVHHFLPEHAACILHETRDWTQKSAATFQSPVMIVEMVVALRYALGSYDQSAKLLLEATATSYRPTLRLFCEERFVCPLILGPPRHRVGHGAPVGGVHGELLGEALERRMPVATEKHPQMGSIQENIGYRTGSVVEMRLEVMVLGRSSRCWSASRPVLVRRMAQGVKGSMMTAAEAVGAGAAVAGVDVVVVADAGEVGVADVVVVVDAVVVVNVVVVVDACGDAVGTGMAGSIACPLDDIVLDDAGVIGGGAARIEVAVEEEAA